MYYHGETNWVTWGAVRASSQRFFWTPLERRRRADLALLTRERLQTKIVNMIGTGKPKEIGSAHCMLCPLTLEALYVAKWEALAFSVQFDGLVLVVTPIPKKYMLIL